MKARRPFAATCPIDGEHICLWLTIAATRVCALSGSDCASHSAAARVEGGCACGSASNTLMCGMVMVGEWAAQCCNSD
jgi:hypothetical protein